MADASLGAIAWGIIAAIALGMVDQVAEGARGGPRAIAVSDTTAEFAERSLEGVASARIGRPPLVRTSSDDDAVSAFCRGEAAAALVTGDAGGGAPLTCSHSGRSGVSAPLAYLSVAILVPVDNRFVDALSIDQLRRIFGPESDAALTFHDLDPRWPKISVHRYGVEANAGGRALLDLRLHGVDAGRLRTFSAPDDVAAAVSQDRGGIGFAGVTRPGVLAHSVRLIPIRGAEAVGIYPTREALESGAYPLGQTIRILTELPASQPGSSVPVDAIRNASSTVVAGADCLAVRRPRIDPPFQAR